MAANDLSAIGLPLKFTLRACSRLADVGAALLVCALVRRRRSERDALASGILTAASPILLIVSGFHGNTDPVFVMLVLLGLFLLVDKNSPCLAGLVMAMAVSIKLVPVVLIPGMVTYTYRRGRGVLVRFGVPLVGLSGLIWGPALASERTAIQHNVLGYTGAPQRWWGIPQLATWAGWPRAGSLIAEKGSLFLVAMLAILAALVILRKPWLVVEVGALSLCGFLLLTPASGTQYLVWAMASAYLLGLASATVLNLSGGALLFLIYTRWSGGLPWNVANCSVLTTDERLFAGAVWLALLTVVLHGLSITASLRQLDSADCRRYDSTPEPRPEPRPEPSLVLP
jgi:hypothetical protein